MKSELFSSLPDVTFADKDPDTIQREVIRLYEDASGRTLARADPVRLFIDAVILAVIQQRNVIDNAAKMNLLAYSSGSYLDQLGALFGVTRLTPQPALTTIRFTLTNTLTYPAVIPQGSRITPGDGVIFATTHDLTIPAGELAGNIEAVCETAGTTGNGYASGQVRKLMDTFTFGVSAQNLTETNGGTDTESDENFRERIQIAPESFSVAGPTKAYEYWARSANSDIIAVSVMGPPDTNPGNVEIYPLMSGGTLPSAEVLLEVYNACNADNVRPDTDYVHVLTPIVVDYNLDMTYWIDAGKSAESQYLRSSVEGAVDEWVLWQRKSLGRDINPSELVKRVVEAGAKRCEVREPGFRVLRANELGVCAGVNVVYGGLEEG